MLRARIAHLFSSELLRLRAFALRQVALAGAVAVFLCACSLPEAEAASRWWSKTGGYKKWIFMADAGFTYQFHYNRLQTIRTPPDALMPTVNLNLFYRSQFGFYLVGGYGLTTPRTTIVGGGVKLPFISLRGEGTSSVGVMISAVLDVVIVDITPPTAPDAYDANSIAPRFGMCAQWALKGKLYLNTTLLGTKVSDSFLFAPFLGLGMRF